LTGNSILGNELKTAELSKELANFVIDHKLHTRLSVAQYGDGYRAVVSCLTDSQSLWSPVLNLVAYHVGNAHYVSFCLLFISSFAETLILHLPCLLLWWIFCIYNYQMCEKIIWVCRVKSASS